MNSLVGVGTSNGGSRAESVISSSGMSDSETASRDIQLMPPHTTGTNYSTSSVYSVLDIPPPVPGRAVEKEIVTYSKEVQTAAAWVPEEIDGEEDSEEVLKRRIDEEVRKELDLLRIDEERMKEEELRRQEAEKEVPGTSLAGCADIVISEEEQQRILTSDSFNDFLSRSSKIVERTLDEDYDVLADYTRDVEANQYITLISI